jgi:hypothetical protein
MTRIIASRENNLEDDSTKQLLNYVEQKISDEYRWLMANFEDKFKKKFEGKLCFTRFKGNFTAVAEMARESITVSLPAILQREHLDVLIHELGHFITEDQGYTGDFIKSPHCFMFAILCSVLRRDLLGQKAYFFDPYDFHEDVYYRKLILSPYEYDQRIVGIQYKDFDDLLIACEEFSNELHQAINELEHIKLVKRCSFTLDNWKQQ